MPDAPEVVNIEDLLDEPQTLRCVIIFDFPEPKSQMELAVIAQAAKETFQDIDDIKVRLTKGDASRLILGFLKHADEETESGLVSHARREMELIESDQSFIDCIVDTVRAFSMFGHSGGSASVAIPIINKLLQYQNLSSLTDDPKEWLRISDEAMWQSCRNPEAFSDDGGKTYYLLSEGANSQNPNPKHPTEPAKIPGEE